LSVDPQRNRVVVGIDPFSDEVAAALLQLYGPLVEVVEHEIERML